MTTRSVPKKSRGAARGMTPDDAQKVLRQVRTSPPLFTKEVMYKLESAIADDRVDGEWRRIALAVLTQSGAEFIDAVAADPEYAIAVSELQEALNHYVRRLKEVVEFMGTAQLRAAVALANREDYHAVVREAKSESASREARP